MLSERVSTLKPGVWSPLIGVGNRKRLRARRSSSKGNRPPGDGGWVRSDKSLEGPQMPTWSPSLALGAYL